jgi:pantoate--beta-alanine ligase
MILDRRSLLTGTAAAAALPMLGGLPRAARAQGNTLKIGVLNDMSGLYRDISGPTSVACVRQAVQDFGNRGGLTVEVVSADHQNKPDVGSNIARQWFDRDGVDVIVDVPTSSVALAVAGVVKEKNKVYLNSTAASADLTGPACTPNTVHWTYDTWMLARSTGGAMVKAGGDTWFFITADYDLVFHPGVDDVYPPGAVGVTVDPGPLGGVLEGAVRPGHFAGVLTVVAKLFALVRPDLAFFGEKDYQQLTLIRAMARELALGVEVVGVPTVREADGLALSSRNRYLDPAQRAVAVGLSRALRAGADAGPQGADAVLAAARAELAGRPSLTVDYLALTDPDLGPVPAAGAARLLVAARAGTTRLIDNVPVRLGADGGAPR